MYLNLFIRQCEINMLIFIKIGIMEDKMDLKKIFEYLVLKLKRVFWGFTLAVLLSGVLYPTKWNMIIRFYGIIFGIVILAYIIKYYKIDYKEF